MEGYNRKEEGRGGLKEQRTLGLSRRNRYVEPGKTDLRTSLAMRAKLLRVLLTVQLRLDQVERREEAEADQERDTREDSDALYHPLADRLGDLLGAPRLLPGRQLLLLGGRDVAVVLLRRLGVLGADLAHAGGDRAAFAELDGIRLC